MSRGIAARIEGIGKDVIKIEHVRFEACAKGQRILMVRLRLSVNNQTVTPNMFNKSSAAVL